MKPLQKPARLRPGDTVAAVSLSWGGAGDAELLWRYELGKQRILELALAALDTAEVCQQGIVHRISRFQAHGGPQAFFGRHQVFLIQKVVTFFNQFLIRLGKTVSCCQDKSDEY